MTNDLSHVAGISARLEAIEHDLAQRQHEIGEAAMQWFRLKRDKEKRYAEELVKAEGPVEVRKAIATMRSIDIGRDEEANWEATRAVTRVLETRATIGMSLLKLERDAPMNR